MPKHRAASLLTAVIVAAALVTGSAATQDPIDRIREADIKADLFTLASDAMRGREAGTLDELKASAWIVERARAAGLEPAGDDGTYLQFFPLERLRVSESSSVTLDGKPLVMGRDVLPDAVVAANLDAPVTVANPDKLDGLTLKDRVLVVRYAPAEQPVQDASPRTVAAIRTWLRGIQRATTAAAPAAIVALVPDAAQDQWNRVAINLPRGLYGLDPDDRRLSTGFRCSMSASQRWADPSIRTHVSSL